MYVYAGQGPVRDPERKSTLEPWLFPSNANQMEYDAHFLSRADK